jgi:hypothetical protein
MATPLDSSEPLKRVLSSRVFKGLLVISVVLAVLITGVLASGPQTSQGSIIGDVTFPYHQQVLSGAIVLNPDGDFLTGFYVPDGAKTAELQCNFYAVANNDTNNGVIMTIWSQKEFLNYFSCQKAVPCYNRDMMPAASANFNLDLKSGQYIILISDASTEPRTIQVQMDLNCT